LNSGPSKLAEVIVTLFLKVFKSNLMQKQRNLLSLCHGAMSRRTVF